MLQACQENLCSWYLTDCSGMVAFNSLVEGFVLILGLVFWLYGLSPGLPIPIWSVCTGVFVYVSYSA